MRVRVPKEIDARVKSPVSKSNGEDFLRLWDLPESSSGLSPSGAANYLGSVLIAEAPPNLAPGLVAGVLLWRVIGWLTAPGDWAPGVEGWEAGIRPGER